MAFPDDVIWEVAFNNDIDETRYAQSGYTEITEFVRNASGRLRGREYEIGRIEAGTVRLVLDNTDGRFTGGTPRSPYYPNVKSNRRLRARGKNMVHPNVARSGSRDRDLRGFLWASQEGYTSPPAVVDHSAVPIAGLPVDDDLTHHLEATISNGAVATTRILAEWHIPVEYGVRLTHSMYVWRVSGTEPSGTTMSLQLRYFDGDGAEVLPLSGQRPRSSVLASGTPVRVAVAHAPVSTAKYAFATLYVTNSSAFASEVVYGLAAVQSELSANLAPDMGATWDTNMLQLGGTSTVRTNHMWNPSAEVNATGYAVNANLNPSHTTATARTGTGSVALTTTGAVQGQVYFPTPAFSLPVTPGSSYSVSAYFRSAAVARLARCRIVFRNVPGSTNLLTSTGDQITTTTSSWTRASVTGVAPAAATHMIGIVEISNPAGAGEVHYVDDVLIEEAGGPGSYFSGATTGFAWTGTAHLSTSTGSIATVWARNATDSSAEVVWQPGVEAAAITVPHLVPGNEYQLVASMKKGATADPNVLVTADDGQSGTTVSTTSFTTTRLTFTATEVEQVIKFVPSGTWGGLFAFRYLTVERYFGTDVSAPASEAPAPTTWQRPLDIFEGWIEGWPSSLGSSEMTITAVDRLKRLGEIELLSTYGEAILQDTPAFWMPLNDATDTETRGQFAQSGWWGNEGAMAVLDISQSKGDIGASNYYTTGIIGPMGQPALRLLRASATQGYFFAIPYLRKPIALPEGALPGTTKPPPPTTTKRKYAYSKTYWATWSRSYAADGSTRSNDPADRMYHGTADGFNGNQRSLIGFNWVAIKNDLAGATIKAVLLTLKNDHARWNRGLYFWLGTHEYSGKPSTWSTSAVSEGRWKRFIGEGDRVGFDLGTAPGYEFKSGSTKGIALGPCFSDCNDNYGWFRGAATAGGSLRPSITIVWEVWK